MSVGVQHLTDIAFHFNVEDRLTYVCRLLRKATNGGARVVVVGPAASLDLLDATLWNFSATDFIPHCDLDANGTVLSASPVLLASSLSLAPSFGTLINLNESIPSGFEQFERLIEIVTFDDSDRKSARARWKHYTDAGFNLVRHDLQKRFA